MKKYFKLLRVKHYIKNLLIFVPAFFGKAILDINTLLNLFIAFFCFSFVASAIYVINDIRDCDLDRQHEEKRSRPIAAGEITKAQALIIASLITVVAFVGVLWLGHWKITAAFIYLGLYIILNLIYSFGAKRLAIVDILILASGFVIRTIYGASVANIECSSWLLLLIMTLSLYLGIGKRRNELIKTDNCNTREVLKKYSVKYLDNMMRTFLTLSLVFYSLWSAGIDSPNKERSVWSLPFVVAIVMRYELDIEHSSYGDPVETIYKDKILVMTVFAYAVVMFYLIYGV